MCCNNQILHRIACPSHCMFSVSIINQNIVKCYYLRIHIIIFLYCLLCHLPYDPNTMSKHLYLFFLTDCFEKHIDQWLFWHCFINIIFQGGNTLHQKVSRLHWKYQHYNSIFIFWCKNCVTQFYIHTLYCIYLQYRIFRISFHS